MRRSPRQLIRRLGFDVARYPAHSTLHGHLRWLLNAEQVTTVFDVGANQGQFAKKLRTETRFKGKIVSFEPFPESRLILEEAARHDPAWTSLPFALGDRDEELRLLTFQGSDWNSLHGPDHRNLAASGRSLEPLGSVPVDVRRLDGVWAELVDRDDVVFVKSDTQGHDLRALTGAGSRLRDAVGLLLEASVVPFYDDEPTLVETLVAVADHGFTPTGFFEVARSKSSRALTTVDVCFVRTTK